MGWLKIDRKIRDNWIWEDPVKLKWRIDILLTVNFEDKKVETKKIMNLTLIKL